MSYNILKVKNLKKYFNVNKRIIRKAKILKAVDGLSFYINKGETFGLVGESGCGKSTTGRMLLKLIEPTEGEIWFKGKDITKINEDEMLTMRKEIQMIFQDPYSSLNPRQTIGEILSEPLRVHYNLNHVEKFIRICKLLEQVGLSRYHIDRYPHEFSGGQRQRIGIARALAVDPELIIADEPVSALDVSIKSQILKLMKDLQKELTLTYLFISHDLSIVEHICDRVGVMYLGKFVEIANTDSLFNNTKHPYTKALISAIPVPNPRNKKERIILRGEVPSAVDIPMGCNFHNRCDFCMERCKEETPIIRQINEGHFVACHLY